MNEQEFYDRKTPDDGVDLDLFVEKRGKEISQEVCKEISIEHIASDIATAFTGNTRIKTWDHYEHFKVAVEQIINGYAASLATHEAYMPPEPD